MAKSILNYFSNKDNKKIVQRCIDSGIRFKNQEIIIDSKLSGKIFVITGSLVVMKRSMVKEKIEKNNARLSTSISNNTDFLILGDNPGSKFEKAKKMKIKIINEEEFLIMLENS